MSGYPGNRANQQPSAGYPGSERAPPAVTQQSDPHSLSPQQVAMSTCHLCCSCLLIVSLIATIPIGFLVWQGTRDVLDDEEFQLKCIDQYDDDIAMSLPNDLELDVLMACTYIMILALMGFCYLAKKKKDSLLRMCAPCLLGTSGGVLIITAFALSALFIHVFWYLNELNFAFYESSPLDCYIDDQWEDAYNGASYGLAVGLCVFLFFCCVVYLTFKLRKSFTLGNLKLKQEQAVEVIDRLGFSIATTWNISMIFTVLQYIQPFGQRALRDAIAMSISGMAALKIILNKLGVVDHRFIHIVLTDGIDNKSERSLGDIKGVYHKFVSDIGDTYFKSYFIGVELGPQEKRELQSIADLAGDAVELLNCDDAKKLSEIFSHITLSLGIERRVALNTEETNATGTTEETFYLKKERQKFLVLLDLDTSASMSGNRWNSLLSALRSFFCGFDDSDVIGCVLFNHKASGITGDSLSTMTQKLGIHMVK